MNNGEKSANIFIQFDDLTTDGTKNKFNIYGKRIFYISCPVISYIMNYLSML